VTDGVLTCGSREGCLVGIGVCDGATLGCLDGALSGDTAGLEGLKELSLVLGRVDWKDVQMENAQVVRSKFESVHAKDISWLQCRAKLEGDSEGQEVGFVVVGVSVG
jgi:hypothetical protein